MILIDNYTDAIMTFQNIHVFIVVYIVILMLSEMFWEMMILPVIEENV